jgi:acyl-coenzyme A thioesterase PaaI-like protein
VTDSNTRTRTVTWTDPLAALPAAAGQSGLDFMKAVVSGELTGPVRCEAVVVYRGGRVATSEGKLYAEHTGKLLAHGTSTCMIIPR